MLDDITSKWITSIRFILAVLVVAIHSYPNLYIAGEHVFSRLSTWTSYFLRGDGGITSCAVPTFFFFSGYLQFVKGNEYRNILRKRVHTILIPYFLWISIYIIVLFIIQTFVGVGFAQNSSGDVIKNWSVVDWLGAYVGYGRSTGKPIIAPLWFLRDLMMLIIISPIIKRIFRYKKIKYLYFIVLFILFVLNVDLYVFHSASLFWFSIGSYCGFIKFLFFEFCDRFNWCILVTLFSFLFVINHTLMGDSFISLNAFISIICVLMILKLSGFIIKNEPLWQALKKLDRYTFFIYCFHDPFVIAILNRTWCRIFPIGGVFDVINQFLPIVLCTLISLCVAIILEKVFPAVFLMLIGNRKNTL